MNNGVILYELLLRYKYTTIHHFSIDAISYKKVCHRAISILRSKQLYIEILCSGGGQQSLCYCVGRVGLVKGHSDGQQDHSGDIAPKRRCRGKIMNEHPFGILKQSENCHNAVLCSPFQLAKLVEERQRIGNQNKQTYHWYTSASYLHCQQLFILGCELFTTVL